MLTVLFERGGGDFMIEKLLVLATVAGMIYGLVTFIYKIFS